MNKVTLSVAALSAIVVPAQVHAATDDEIAAKKKAIEQLRIELNAAANKIEAEAVDVKEKYLNELSAITAAMNKAYDDDTVLSDDQINTWRGGITAAKNGAVEAQEPYTAKEELQDEWKTLNEQYQAALVIASNKTAYPNVSAQKVEALKELGVEALGKQIDDYDPTKTTILDEQDGVSTKIKTAKSNIKNLVDNIDKDEAAVAGNEEAHSRVDEAYKAAKALYDAQLQEALKNLPTPVYEDWQNEAVAKLNDQYRIINGVKKADDALYAEEKSATKVTEHLNTIGAAKAEIENIVDGYVAKMQKEEDAKKVADSDVKALQDALDGIKKQLSDRKLTECDADIAAVQKSIDDLTAELDGKYKKHEIDGYKYADKVVSITADTNEIDDNANPPHPYKDIVANYDANKSMVEAIAKAQKTLTDNETAAKKASADGKYNAADHFTGDLAAVQKSINDLTSAVDNAYKTKTAVKYKEETFAGKLGAIDKGNNGYKTNTAAALAAYDAAQKTAADAQTKLEALKEKVTDPTVTVNGTLDGTSYQDTFENIEKEIKAINDQIAAADALKDAAHLKAIQDAAKLTIAENIDALTTNYDANKAAYDKASAIKAANAVLAASESRIKAVQEQINAIEGDFGIKENDINAAKKEMQTELDNVAKIRTDAKDAFEKVTDEDKKQEAAAKAIEVLAKVNEELAAMENGLGELQAKADNAKANKAAFDKLNKLADDIIAAADKVNTEKVEKYATDEAAIYWGNWIARIKNYIKDNLKNQIKTKYEADPQTIAADTEIEKELNKIKDTEIDKIDSSVVPNENKHKAQTSALNDLQKAWQTTYDTVSNTDLSDAAAGYLQELAKLQERINKHSEKVAKDFGEGMSDANDEANMKEIKAIQDAIVAVKNASADNYEANVDKTNADQHSNFEAAYKTANTTFSNAVNALNDFSNIENAALKTALDNLTKTHDDIYAYADKLRELKSKELADYMKYVNDKTDGVDDIYNSEKWIKTANDYNAEIAKLIKDYEDAVNQVAYDEYSKLVAGANNMLTAYENSISSFVYAGKADAFKDVKDVITAADAAGAKDADGTIHDKYYAVHMDEWLTTLNNVNAMLKADLEKVSTAEAEKRISDINDLYESEKNEIAKFAEIDNAKYLRDLDNLKKAFDEAVNGASYLSSYDKVMNSIIPAADKYAKYDDKAKLGHSKPYTDAYSASVANQKNIEAYNRMIETLDLLDSDFNDVKTIVETMIVGNQKGTTYAKLNAIADLLKDDRAKVEGWKNTGACVAEENGDVYKAFGTDVQKNLDELKQLAVADEVIALNAKIDKVKEEYNQVAKEDLDKVKDFDAKIQKLYDDVAAIKEKYDKKGIELFEGVAEQLVEQEAAIAAVNKSLNDMYENTQTAEAIAAIGTAVDKAEAAVAQAEGWANYDEVTQKEYLAEVQALRGELELIKADYEAKNAAGQILFYQDNIIFNLTNVLKDTPSAPDSDLYKLYSKRYTNDQVYNNLLATVNTAEEALKNAYDNVKDFTHRRALKEVDWIEYNKEIIGTDIADRKKELEEAHDAVKLDWTVDLNDFINDYAERVYDYERGAKYYEMNGQINDLQENLDGTLAEIQEKLYGGDRQSKLVETYNDIIALLAKAYSFNYDAADGWIANDIYGNDIRQEISGYKYEVQIDYNVDAWKILVDRMAELNKEAEQLANDAVALSYILGDADNDKRVTVNDYSEVRDMILKAAIFKDVDEAKRYAADVNGDEEFTVADMTGVSNIIFHGKWNWSPADDAANAPAKTRAKVNTAAEDVMTLSNEGEETTIFGKTIRVAINVAHSEAFVAGQMDVTMPQGMKIAGQSLSDRANGHDIFANNLGNGVTRIIAATVDNNEFSGRSGALIYLDVEVGSDYNGGQIVVDNIVFSDAKAISYSMASIGGGEGTTGIDGIEAATVKERIYSVGGQMMKAVKKGINIIVGEDGKSRKVINK